MPISASDISILIVSPFETVTAGLHSLLDDATGLSVIGEAHGSGELVDLLGGVAPNIVLVDDERVDRARLIEVMAIADSRLVLLAEPSEIATLADVRRTGPFGLLPKSIEETEIIAAIRAVDAALNVVHSAFGHLLFPTASREPDSPRETASGERLTPRERQVLQLIAGGLPNKQIASRLDVSPHTVKFHVASVLAKLGASSRAEAVTVGARLGYVML